MEELYRIVANSEWGEKWQQAIPKGTVVKVVRETESYVLIQPLIRRLLPNGEYTCNVLKRSLEKL